jgi:aldehyde dehydrogenase (NAD+)
VIRGFLTLPAGEGKKDTATARFICDNPPEGDGEERLAPATPLIMPAMPHCGGSCMAGSFPRAFVQGCLPDASFLRKSPERKALKASPEINAPKIKRFTLVNRMQFYIDGAWVDPAVKKSTPVVNPATEEAMYEIALGSKADVDKAVAAARGAFESYSQTSREERVALLSKIIEVYKTRMKDIGAAVSDEMGAPLPFAEKFQAGAGLGHIASTLDVLKNYNFEEQLGTAMVVREPVGVIGMITPWNWPLNQIACKVAPALAAGCTMILKPSEFTPSSALIFAEILHEAGVPKGVFNLINGLGPEVGAAMSEHPGIDMISFTGP